MTVLFVYFALILLGLCVSLVESSRISPVAAVVTDFQDRNIRDSSNEIIADDSLDEGLGGLSKGDQDDNESTKIANGIQYMITNNMRNVLENELGYLAEEVRCMEPQIAAVVIEKKLVRPARGMPPSWARTDAAVSLSKPKTAFSFGLFRSFRSFKSSAAKYAYQMASPLRAPIRTVHKLGSSICYGLYRWSPVIIPAASLVYVGPLIFQQLEDSSSWVLSAVDYAGQKLRAVFKRDANRKVDARIDIRALNAATKISWRDRLSNMFSSSN